MNALVRNLVGAVRAHCVRIATVAAVTGGAMTAARAGAQPCTVVPLQPFEFGGRITSGAVFDEDGPGGNPPRFFGGTRYFFHGEGDHKLKRFDGAEWTPVAGAPPASEVHAMTVYDDGRGHALYIGADRNVWRYDGSGWELVTIPNKPEHGKPTSFAVLDPDGAAGAARGQMFVHFRTPNPHPLGGPDQGRIFGFDGSGWEALPVLFSAGRLVAYDPDDAQGPRPPQLYYYQSGVKRWEDGLWVTIADNIWIHSATVFRPQLPEPGPPQLIVAGRFEQIGTGAAPVQAKKLARWDGEQWAPLIGAAEAFPGGWWPNDVELLAPWDPDGGGPRPRMLAVAGQFTRSAGAFANRFGFFDGVQWHDPGQNISAPSTHIYLMRTFDADHTGPEPPKLIVSGVINNINGQLATSVALWRDDEGGSWDHLGPGPAGPVHTLSIFNDGTGLSLFAGGIFPRADERTVNNIARWDGQTWRPLGLGIVPVQSSPSPMVRTTLVHHDGAGWALFAGGRFGRAGEADAINVARWRQRVWEPLGAGLAGGEVFALAAHDADGAGPLVSRLYAAGTFTNSGGSPVRRLGVWDGVQWREVGGGIETSGQVRALRSWDDGNGPALYVGGDEMSAGCLLPNIALRWRGEMWEELPRTGFVEEDINGFTIHDEGEGMGLYALGRFVSPHPNGHSTIQRAVLRLDHDQWVQLTAHHEVDAFEGRSFDPGGGRILTVGNRHFGVGGAELPVGEFPATRAVSARFDDGSGEAVYFGGSGMEIWYSGTPGWGIRPAARITRMRTCIECWANCDGSSSAPVLNVDDFTCFINRFTQGMSLAPAQQVGHYANCDGSTAHPALNIDDFHCFLVRFVAGCP